MMLVGLKEEKKYKDEAAKLKRKEEQEVQKAMQQAQKPAHRTGLGSPKKRQKTGGADVENLGRAQDLGRAFVSRLSPR